MESLRVYDINEDEIKKLNYAIIKTSKGDMKVKLYPKEAPQTVMNFATLAKEGFYEGLIFHRVIPGFVAQGGCPYGTGTGGPGWRIKCECVGQKRFHQRGSLSMAHAGRDTGGSQFFICFEPQPHLNGVHTIFGDLIDNEDLSVLDKIKENDKILNIEIKDKLDNE